VWIGGGCLGAQLLIRYPLVDGAGDSMLRAISNFLSIGHPLSANMNEWIEVIAAGAELASDGQVRLGCLGGQ
jgi:hypothetical protein